MRVLCVLCVAAALIAGSAALHGPRPAPAASEPAPAPPPPAPAADVPHRSPTDVALSPDGRFLLTANHTADTASLIDAAAGKVVAEVPVGKRPYAAAIAPDGRRAAVSNTRSGTVTLLAWSDAGTDLKVAGELRVGHEPRGLTWSADGKTLFVVCTLDDAVAAVDVASGEVRRRAEVGSRPWHLARSPDGTKLAVANSRSNDVVFLDAATLEAVRKVRTTGDNLRRVVFSPDGTWALTPHIYTRGFPATQGNIGRGWVVANHLTRVPLEKGGRQAIALDVNGKAVGDADGIAVSPDGKWIAITAGGTHELLLLANDADVPWIEFGGPGDFIDDKLLRKPGAFRRVALGGRPLGVVFSGDSKTCYVSNYFDNSVQIIDVASAANVKTIALGGPEEITPQRRGEMLFMDATLSHHQWYSCHSCHTEGHTNGVNFDTLNDKRYGNAKKTVTLRGVTETGPWTWHGWQTDLTDAAARSVVESMQGRPIGKADAEAVVAYLRTLDFPPNPYRAPDGGFTDAAKRGREVFRSEKAGCNRCHTGETFTDGQIHDVGTGEAADAFRGYNPPDLRGAFDRFPYLHDGRAKTLESLLTRHHAPEKVTKKGTLSAEELRDLIEYLRQL